jgi:hypothetical protein
VWGFNEDGFTGGLTAHSALSAQRFLAEFHRPTSVPATNLRVPHISLVFREMWDSANPNLPFLNFESRLQPAKVLRQTLGGWQAHGTMANRLI